MVKIGCRNCRRRHSKCVVLEGTSACTKCAEIGRPCQFAPRYRFRLVRHIYQKEGDARSRFILAWDRGQPWVEVSKPCTYFCVFVFNCLFLLDLRSFDISILSVTVSEHPIFLYLIIGAARKSLIEAVILVQFVDENGDVPTEVDLGPPGHSAFSPSFFADEHAPKIKDSSTDARAYGDSDAASDWSPTHIETQSTLQGQEIRDSRTIVRRHGDPIDNERSSPTSVTYFPEVSSPSKTHNSESSISLDQAFLSSGLPRRDSCHSFLSPREAFLLRLFIQKISPWVSPA